MKKPGVFRSTSASFFAFRYVLFFSPFFTGDLGRPDLGLVEAGNRVLVYDATDGDLVHSLKGHKEPNHEPSTKRTKHLPGTCYQPRSWHPPSANQGRLTPQMFGRNLFIYG